MRLIVAAVALLVLGLIISSMAALILKGGAFKMAQGEARCEGLAPLSSILLHPPVQRVWNKATYPETDIDSLIVRGLTLCDR
jgi:hypothetical protein